MAYTPSLDGDITLKATEDRCELEQEAGYQLKSIVHGTETVNGKVLPVNKCVFERKRRDRLKDLHFEKVPDGKTRAQVQTTLEGQGWSYICDGQIYVKNHITTIVVVGKNDFPPETP